MCEGFFAEDEADAACRQLMFSGGAVMDAYDFLEGEYLLADVKCGPGATSLNQCTYNYDRTRTCYNEDGYSYGKGPVFLECA